ncbi:MAG: YidC/Oxa1 family membrane protein insertase [Bacilli bacterium]|nr:YidC/Oxa1 family membrane protein insertase [Bacilli bacterium]
MNKKKKLVLILLVPLLLTGCTKVLKDSDNKAVINEVTGQNLTENILCRPTDADTIKLYEENNVDIDSLPYCVCKSDKVEKEEIVKNEETGEEETKIVEENCESFSITKGVYDGLWTSIFVKPLAYVILFFGRVTKNYGLGLIITSLIIRLISYPVTRKTAMQSEYMKKAQPEMEKIEKKYANKDQNDKEVMMQKSQEMMMVYKKYNVSPVGGCLLTFLQLPLFIAFLEAINRVPAIFEEKFLTLHLGTTPSIGVQNGNYLYIVVVLVVAATTFFSFRATMKDQTSTTSEMAQQQKMMTNMFTIMIIVMSIFMTTALDIYWMTTNLFTIVQNIIVKRKVK